MHIYALYVVTVVIVVIDNVSLAIIHTVHILLLTINSDGITCHHSTHTYNGHTDIIIIINT